MIMTTTVMLNVCSLGDETCAYDKQNLMALKRSTTVTMATTMMTIRTVSLKMTTMMTTEYFLRFRR